MRLFPGRLADYQNTLPIYPRAVDYWAVIANELDEDVELQIGGGLMVADSQQQLAALEEKCRCERQSGLDTDIVGRQELQRLAPYLHSATAWPHAARFVLDWNDRSCSSG